MRHQYVYWRLKIGKVKIQTLAANIGSSVQRIEENYGHIKPIEYARELVANQDYEGRVKRPDELTEELEKFLTKLKSSGTEVDTYDANDL